MDTQEFETTEGLSTVYVRDQAGTKIRIDNVEEVYVDSDSVQVFYEPPNENEFSYNLYPELVGHSVDNEKIETHEPVSEVIDAKEL